MTYILLPRLVIAVFSRLEVFCFENSTSSDMLSKCLTANAHARSKPSAILVGWMPRSNKASLCSRRAPARTLKEIYVSSDCGNTSNQLRNVPTTPVVPSPISSSWLFDSCTRSFAIWWSTSICPRMVAPSLVTLISPSGEIKILSRPD